MARIRIIGPIGELSGKLSGQVFARNKSGYYVRANAIGTNPNTDAQIRARTAFATASSQYHSLTSPQKVAWQNFATNDFVPKGGTVPGTLSGFNAWVSTRAVVENATQMIYAPTTLSVNGTPATVTNTGYGFSSDTPNSMLQSGLVDDNNDVFGIQITAGAGSSGSGSSLTNVELTLNASGVVSPPSITTFDGPITGGKTKVGFAVYASKGQQQQAMFVENPEEYLISYLPSFEFATSKTFDDVKLVFNLQNDVADYQNLPNYNEWTRLTLYTVSLNGMMTKVGSKMIQVGA